MLRAAFDSSSFLSGDVDPETFELLKTETFWGREALGGILGSRCRLSKKTMSISLLNDSRQGPCYPGEKWWTPLCAHSLGKLGVQAANDHWKATLVLPG